MILGLILQCASQSWTDRLKQYLIFMRAEDNLCEHAVQIHCTDCPLSTFCYMSQRGVWTKFDINTTLHVPSKLGI